MEISSSQTPSDAPHHGHGAHHRPQGVPTPTAWRAPAAKSRAPRWRMVCACAVEVRRTGHRGGSGAHEEVDMG